ncbi:probable ATP-dependent RNA helicase spindle-E [Ooceraea biroi]|uniref:probable ATP-dependent RNA helicase spindle-E n=1 Tax=Ooceraea biroi TaxID=2015173 RepID=UPI000F08A339|nr:probable ATP-dependent RNA helicase spindle-E [Ooceraea biroi]
MDLSVKIDSIYRSAKAKVEETGNVKSYAEAQAETYLKLYNAIDNRKEFKPNQTSQSLEENLYKLCVEDVVDQKNRNFIHRPKLQELPILSMKDKILSIIETNSVVVIQGPTGCGKTTQIPQFILDSNIKKRLNCNIIVTQPRRIAAISVARRVSHEEGWPVGSLVGFKVGMHQEVSPDTRLTYCTTGVLLQILINQKHMLDYTHVILDEIHERDQDLDFLLLVVKKLLQTNSKQVKVILMSATINVKKFAKYFSMRVGNDLVPTPIIEIPERRRYEIRTYYLDDIDSLGTIPEVSVIEPTVTDTMINFCSRIIIALDQVDIDEDVDSSQRHTVLVFLPGIYEIQDLYNYLSSVYHKDKLWDLAILHSLISSDEQHHIFHNPPEGHRRIILSTNIAESSITVPDVKYVIDFCLVKVLIVDPVSHTQSLQLHWASKANCDQRAGRAGRVMDGRVYRLVSKAFYNNILIDESTPEMLRAPLTTVVLRAKVLDLDEPRKLLSLSLNPPTVSNLRNSILVLKEVGALVNEDDSFQPFDGRLTNLGRIMASLPLDIRISKLIMLGHVFGILRDAIVLGASMAIKNVFNVVECRPSISSYAIRRKWARDSDSDCIATLNVYKVWQNEKANRRLTTYQAERQWAQRNGVQIKALHELDILVTDITNRLRMSGIEDSVGVNKIVWQAKEHDFILEVILTGAFYPNYFVKRWQSSEDHKNNIIMSLDTWDPTKTVYLRGWPINQPGYLYAKNIQEIFSKHHGLPEKQLAVSFDTSNRVFIQFRRRETVPTDESLNNISNFVYQAIKMRHCNVPIEIKLLDESEARRRAESHDLWRFEQSFFFHKTFQKKRSEISKIRPELPDLDVTCIPLCIQTIINPGYFWAIVDDVATHEKLRSIEKALNSHQLKELSSCSESVSSIVAAPMRKNESLIYHRAIIEEIFPAGGLVDVFFIDYGRSSRVQYSDLRKIDNNVILQIPCLAFCCSLAFLRSSNQINFQNRWSEISKNYFRTQVKRNGQIFGKIYSVVDSIVNLELIVVNNKGEQLNINESFVEKRYAVKREESYLSKHNHELRADIDTIDAMSTEKREFYREMQYDRDDLLQYPDPPKKKDCQSSIKLQGPFSPLETELVQLTYTKKKAMTEKCSVNSVLLDDDPDQLGRLLVAQSVIQSPNSDDLLLLNTTLLPNIPGLGTLLTLIFAPRMELRCDSRKSYYTGALCGLGPIDKYTARAMYPEHDIGIRFDVEITIDDLKEINKLRFWMSTGMQLNENSMEEDIINCQNRIKRILFELIDKPRELQTPSIDYFGREWNRYNELCLLSAARETTAGNCDVYPLHKALELYERDEEIEKLLKNISELELLAYEKDIRKDTVSSCQLCELKMIGLLELRLHLCSEQHKRNEQALLRQAKTN